MFRNYVVALMVLGVMLFAPPQAAAAEPETVILLHGYGRTSWSMLPLKKRLEEAGFAVHNVGYPSMRRTPAQLTEILDLELAACCTNSPRIHFVTHSLGGILTRAYLAEHRPPNMGRVVMLAPPNRGSELADLANGISLLHPLLGPTVIQLGTGTGSLPNRLPPPWYETGVIAGVDDFNPLGNLFVPQPSDGTVAVASATVNGMRDFVTVRKSHTFIMWSGDVAEYVIRFLKTGRFQEPEQPEIPPDQ
jgi:pimeloyl-ACP methyl ester carboxylesterase